MKVTIQIEDSECGIDGEYVVYKDQLDTCCIETTTETYFDTITNIENWLKIEAKLRPWQVNHASESASAPPSKD